MKVWKFQNPFDNIYACANLQGTWESSTQETVCPECQASRQRRITPLIIEWEVGSDQIGDFTWPGLGAIAVIESSINTLLNRFGGFKLGPVKMVQDPEVKIPKKPYKRNMVRVWLPYGGPALYEICVIRKANLDMARSTVHLEKACSLCGNKILNVSGIERISMKWDQERGELIKRRIPRIQGEGLYILESSLSGDEIFIIPELKYWTLCTDRVKKYIEDKKFSNIHFFEMGELI